MIIQYSKNIVGLAQVGGAVVTLTYEIRYLAKTNPTRRLTMARVLGLGRADFGVYWGETLPTNSPQPNLAVQQILNTLSQSVH